MRPTVIDLFAGIGGLSDGFLRAGCRILGGVEIDPELARLYETNHRRHNPDIRAFVKDVRDVTARELMDAFSLARGELTFLVGGSPCQGYSTIGKRRIDDERNDLIFEFPRLIRRLRPVAFLIENVPGLLTFDGGRRLALLLDALRAAGYKNSTTAVVDAAACGVPQRRKRVLVFGSRATSLPSFAGLGIPRANGPTVWDAIGDLPSPEELLDDHEPGGRVPYPPRPVSAYARSLRGRTRFVTHWEPVLHTREIIERYEAVDPGGTEARTKCWRLRPDTYARTLRAGTRSRTACRPIHPVTPRVITVREAARLHSFRDSYVFPKSKSGAHLAIGNAVPPFMGRALAEEMCEALGYAQASHDTGIHSRRHRSRQ